MILEFIKEGKVVQLAYTLKDSAGEILDESTTSDPFFYLHGAGQIVPGLEAGLTGLKMGDKKTVTVTPDQGYGEEDPQLRLTVPRTQFPKDIDVKVGMEFEARGPQGPMPFVVAGVEGDQIQIDGNHPLAGETLHFDVEVLGIRDATTEEKSHGHAHGPGGHHHH